jgi:hypothetical protein
MSSCGLVQKPRFVASYPGLHDIGAALNAAQNRPQVVVVGLTEHDYALVREKEVERAIGLPVVCSLVNDYEAASAAAVKGRLIADDTNLGRQLHSLALQIEGAAPEPSAESGWKKLLKR